MQKQKEERPLLEITPGYWDQVMDYAAWGLCLILIVFSVYLYLSPAEMTDAADLRSSVLVLSLLGVAMMIGFHFLKRIPHRFNYLVRITPENAERQYRLALRLIRMINLFVLAEFIAILALTYFENTRQMQVDTGLLIIGIMILGFIPVGYYFWNSTVKRT